MPYNIVLNMLKILRTRPDIFKKLATTLMQSIFSAIGWVVLTSIFGLIQLWIALGIASYMLKSVNVLETSLLDGGILFFVMALVSSISIDFYFDKSAKLPRWLEGVIFFAFPSIVGIYVTVSYTALFFLGKQEINYQTVISSQWYALAWAVIYAFIAKLIQFVEPSWRKIKIK